jgi:DNA polymerase-4
MTRTILHVDMDAFYAAVEQHDHPQLAGLPVIVGGTGNRGVVSTASYEARRFGVHSAQPTAVARRLCPQGVFLPVRMPRYREVSELVFACFYEITDRVEGLSLDEAFLDVSDCLKLFGSPHDIARRIKSSIVAATGLTASVGIAANKFLAKLASDLEKPDGLVVVEQDPQQLLDPLPVSHLWGIGRKAAERLAQLGIKEIGELRTADMSLLREALGNQAGHFQNLARGIDDRAVEPERGEKSVSSEETFDQDLHDYHQLTARLLHHAEVVGRRLRAAGLTARTVTLKLKQSDFTLVTRRHSLDRASDHTMTLYHVACALLRHWLDEHPRTRLRLLGLGVSNFTGDAQPDLFAATGKQRDGQLDQVVDRIRAQFGGAAVTRGRLLGDGNE